jgi:predicted nucleic acid-binding Zn ribbon protein
VVPAHKLIPSVLANVLKNAPLCPEKVEFAWRIAVGPAVARVTSISLDDHGALHVTSSDPHWLAEVRRSSKLILARLATMLGPDAVQRISTATGGRTGRENRHER